MSQLCLSSPFQLSNHGDFCWLNVSYLPRPYAGGKREKGNIQKKLWHKWLWPDSARIILLREADIPPFNSCLQWLECWWPSPQKGLHTGQGFQSCTCARCKLDENINQCVNWPGLFSLGIWSGIHFLLFFLSESPSTVRHKHSSCQAGQRKFRFFLFDCGCVRFIAKIWNRNDLSLVSLK